MSVRAHSESGSDQSAEIESIWIRGLYMALFVLIYGLTEAVVLAVTLIQFGCTAFGEQRNDRLSRLAESLSEFVYQIVCYWMFTSDEKPFPFSDWPRPRAGLEEQ